MTTPDLTLRCANPGCPRRLWVHHRPEDHAGWRCAEHDDATGRPS